MEPGRTQEGSDSLLRQKLAEGLVLSDTEHDLAMQVHKHSSQEATANPAGVSYTAMEPSSGPALGGRQIPGVHAPFLRSCPQPCTLSQACPPPSSRSRAPRPVHHSQAAKPTDPMTAKAGSSCRSKGKSIRKLVLKRAVMVTEGRKARHHGGSTTEARCWG